MMLGMDIVKKKIIYARPTQTSYTSQRVEFPIGIGDAVFLYAIHWHLERCFNGSAEGLFIAALSENPEHELVPPVGVAEFQGNPSLYGMATWVQMTWLAGAAYSSIANTNHLIVPLYGILRPKRQVAVFANVWSSGLTGIRGEVYYQEAKPASEVVDAINRRYGKYRRS